MCSDKDSPEVSLSPEATVLRLLSLEFASLFDLSPIFCKIPSSSQRNNFPLKIVPSIIQSIWKHYFWIRCDRQGKDMRCKSDGPDENGIDMAVIKFWNKQISKYICIRFKKVISKYFCIKQTGWIYIRVNIYIHSESDILIRRHTCFDTY